MKLGDKVTWTSQSGGYARSKTGIVVEVVAAGVRPWPERIGRLSESGLPRNHESYIIRASVDGKRFRLYWPRVGALRRQKQETLPFDHKAGVQDALERFDWKGVKA